MAQRLPQHKATMLSDFGIRLRRITSPPHRRRPSVLYPSGRLLCHRLGGSRDRMRPHRFQRMPLLRRRPLPHPAGTSTSVCQLKRHGRMDTFHRQQLFRVFGKKHIRQVRAVCLIRQNRQPADERFEADSFHPVKQNGPHHE